jgi:hypothetical protein
MSHPFASTFLPQRFLMPTIRYVAVLAGILSLAACNDRFGPAKERTGFISATAYDAGGGAYAMRFLGAFYKYDGLTTGIPAAETCQGGPFNSQNSTVATLPSLSAGQYLYTRLSGRVDTLFQSSGLGITAYQLLTVNAVPFIPGDTLTLEIPGETGGFPGATLRVRTAEAFTHDPVGTGTEGQPLTITWTPAPAPGSLMAFSLRFNSTGTATLADAQISCIFNDDGSGEVNASLAAIWRASQPESRSVKATRIRQTQVVFDANTKVTLLSYFDRPLEPVPGG